MFGLPGAACHVTDAGPSDGEGNKGGVGVPEVGLERVEWEGVSNRSRKFSGTILFRRTIVRLIPSEKEEINVTV